MEPTAQRRAATPTSETGSAPTTERASKAARVEAHLAARRAAHRVALVRLREALDAVELLLPYVAAMLDLHRRLSAGQGRKLQSPRALARQGAGLLRALEAAEQEVARTTSCGARCRDGHRCNAPGVGRGGRCKLHGGASTGPKTAEGKARSLAALGQRPRLELSRNVQPDAATQLREAVAALGELSERAPKKPRTSTWNPSQGFNTKRRGKLLAELARRRLAALRASKPGAPEA